MKKLSTFLFAITSAALIGLNLGHAQVKALANVGGNPNTPLLVSQSAAGSAVTATASETQAAVAKIPANLLTTGSVLRVRFQGIQTAVNSTDSITIRLRFGATTLTGTQVITGAGGAGAVNDVFSGDVILTCRGVPGGAVAIVGAGLYEDAALVSSGTFKPVILASTNFATNANLLVECTIQFGSNSAGNSARVDNFVAEVL